jgi:biotin operon repressor
MDNKEFIEVWKRSSSGKEVAEHFGVSPVAVRARATQLRKLGVPLKDMRRSQNYTIEELIAVATSD